MLTALIYDMIRESGDRGTSILNFLTNFTLFLANVSMCLEKKDWKASAIQEMLTQKTSSVSEGTCSGNFGSLGIFVS